MKKRKKEKKKERYVNLLFVEYKEPVWINYFWKCLFFFKKIVVLTFKYLEKLMKMDCFYKLKI